MARILVVEDEAAVRENVVELLQAEGFIAFAARDGLEGLRMARQELPDLILCDIRMPRLDGFGLLAQVANDPLTASIPFIFLTARTERRDQREGMGAGADDYITKPFTRQDLLGSVRKRLEKRTVLTSLMEQKLVELQKRIDQGLPNELLGPLSVLLGHSEILMKSDVVSNDPNLVRGAAHEINRAAKRLMHLVQNHQLLNELDDKIRLPQREKPENPVTRDAMEVLALFARELAREFHREEDLVLALEPGDLALPEKYLLVIAEELLDRAFRSSLPGTPVELRANFRDDRICHLSVKDRGNRFPGPAASMKGLQYEFAENPAGMLLVRRVVEIYKGIFYFGLDAEGGGQAMCDLPGERKNPG